MSDNDLYEPGDNDNGLDPLDSLTGEDPDEADETGYNPPDREPYNLRRIPTEAEERAGESLEDHLAEEEPDISIDDPEDLEPRAGRLVAPDEGAHADDEADLIAFDAGPAGYASSAEEAAIHVIDEDEDEVEDELNGENAADDGDD